MNQNDTINLSKAKQAIRSGDKRTARVIAQQILAQEPTNEEAWLILAAISPPETAVSYLKRVLEINPENKIAQKGLTYYTNYEHSPKPNAPQQPVIPNNPPPFYKIKKKQILFPWLLIFGCVVVVSLTRFQIIPSFAFPFYQSAPTLVVDENPVIPQVSLTPTLTNTPTFTPSPTSTQTPVPTTTFTITPTDSPSPTTTIAAASKPKDKKKNQQTNSTNTKNKSNNNPPPISPPKGVGANEHWVEVDLSSQRSYAYIGSNRVRMFIVSTGTWLHPTVTGVFKIYVKYRYANMSGPGYFLPDVPYVMYFYQDYGLHGTYWHHNFGVPMSHGCVNYSIPDAAWLYDFVNIGTIVYIHP